MRSQKATEYAKEHGYQFLTTTLSISPHKNAEKINEIGSEVAAQHDLQWYAADFKKRGGYDRSIRMSKEAGLYRQSYCGCIFSQRETAQRRKRRKAR